MQYILYFLLYIFISLYSLLNKIEIIKKFQKSLLTSTSTKAFEIASTEKCFREILLNTYIVVI